MIHQYLLNVNSREKNGLAISVYQPTGPGIVDGTWSTNLNEFVVGDVMTLYTPDTYLRNNLGIIIKLTIAQQCKGDY